MKIEATDKDLRDYTNELLTVSGAYKYNSSEVCKSAIKVITKLINDLIKNNNKES